MRSFAVPGCLPSAAAAWVKARPRVKGAFKRDSVAGTKFWHRAAALLEKLPKKPKRTPEQQLAADIILSDGRRTREEFLAHHAEAIYRKLTKNLSEFRRVDDLAYAAAKLVPGLTPSKKQVDAESASMQSEKDGVEVDQGIFLAQVLAIPGTGSHLCQAMLMPKTEAMERCGEFIKNGVIDFGPARVERQGKAAVVTVNNPRFLNAEDDDTLDDTETAADIAILDPTERNLRAAWRRGRSSEIQRPQDFLRRHQSHASLSRKDSFSLVHPPRHGRREQDVSRVGDGWRQSRRSLRRHA